MFGKALMSTAFVAALFCAPASAVGDATYTLASHLSMAEPAASPADRFMAVYMASAERAEMIERLREKYPFIR